MSATATKLQSYYKTSEEQQQNRAADQQQKSMLLRHEVIAIPATTATKEPACNAQFVAKNNNINNNKKSKSSSNSNHNNGSLGTPCGNNSTQTQKDLALLSNNSAAVSAKHTKANKTTTTLAAKSSLAFCEHCCESASMLSSNSSSLLAHNKQHDRKAVAGDGFGMDADSVSDELSSFRLVSEEDSSNNSVYTATRSEEQVEEEDENRSPNIVPTEQQSCDKQAVVVASARSSSPATTAAATTTICCYTIGRASTHYSATNINQSVCPSAPVFIPPTTFSEGVEVFHFADTASEQLSTSLPSNYGSVNSKAINNNDGIVPTQTRYCSIPKPTTTVKRKNAAPPVPPPKPPQRDQRVARTASTRSGNRAFTRLYYDPASFQRKLQKFEKQTKQTREINEAEHTECSSPEPCELLNCFGAVKHIHPRDRVAIARSASDSSSCCTPSVTSENCIPNNSNNSVANTLPLSAACVSAIEKPCESNNNYNCKILHVAINNNNNNKQCQQHFSSSPALNKRTLRYDSCGRLKAERFYAATVVAGQKSLSESRLPQHLTSAICRKLSFRTDSQSVPPTNGYVHVECANFKQTIPTRKKLPPLTPPTPNSPNSPISPNSPHSPLPSTVSNSPQSHSEIDLSLIAEQQPEIQLFKSYSDTQNNNVLNTTTNESQAHQQHQQQQRCYSDYTLKTSNHQHSTESITFDGCNCATATPSATTTIAVIHQENSVSLPSVSQSNGSQSPPWLSSEIIASSRCDLKGSEDTQSVCSDQTTIFHLEQDCSSSSSPSSQSCGNVILRTPLILKRIPEIQSFGFLPTYSTQSLGNANEREHLEKELSMEKRRNTLDRFQRLGFGRKSSPSPSHAAAAAAAGTAVANQESNNTTRNRKSSEKSERLKELTELLRGNRSSPTPPPVPPPRKPRNGSHSTPSSFEKPDKHSIVMQEETSAADGTPLSFMSTHSDDILLMDQDEQTTDAPVDGAQERKKSKDCHIKSSNTGEPQARSPTREHDTLKPNTSLSSFASLMLGREKSKSPPPIIQVDAELEASTDIDTKLTKPESRTIIGAYTQKGIPFRSASFSQIDYSSGKYKKSALSLLRDRLRRDKAVDRSPSPTVVANITLPRNREKVEEEPTRKEPDWIYIPLKKSELSINLNLNSLHKSLEDVAESPDALTEEDVFADKEDIPAKKFDPAESQAAHAKMESLTDTIQSENDYTIDEEQLPVTVESGNMAETEQPSNAIFIRTIGTAEATPTESNLATLMEEEMPLESPPESFLQTATTCLIPVSVYECAAQDWRLENPPHEWVEVAPEEFGIIPETIEPLVSLEQCSVAQTETKSETTQRSDMVPTISVSRSSEEAEDKELLREKHDCIDGAVQPHDDTIVERRQASLDFPEVKKRYSQDDIEIGTEKRSSLDSIATRLSAEERKRLDKSRRRKGMYIDSTAWTEGAATANRGLALDITIANFNAIKADSPDECSSIMFLNSPITDENHTPGSLYSLDLNTPESECSKPPVWTKNQRLTSFSCQSSEEKDDAHSFGGGSTDAVAVVGVVGGPATVSLPRNNKSYPFLRTDSISDNESERTPPPSRDRTSASPSLSDNDFKRFSKRPLRGPYGQMLEAEMKKPNRMHFEEILEELRESEGISMQPRRQRNAHDGRSYEEPIGAGVTGGHLSSGTGRNMPQYSNSVRVRKTSTYLPVPSHARAASTPSQIENVTGKTNNNNTKNSMDALDPQDQRYQSAQDNAMSRESHDSTIVDASQQKHQSQPQQQQMQSQPQPHPHPPQQQQHHLRDMKRAASEAPTSKPHHSKRSQSMSGEKPALHQHQQKRSLDVNNKSAAAATKQTTTSNLMPTQELLAELLKGSSEKLLSEQRQQMFADTRTHVVQEIFKNEQSYVESLQTVVMKYLKVLKSPEHAGMIDSRTVDEIFFMVPDILEIHEKFLSELRARLDNWDTHQKVGDAFMETFSKLEVLEVYTSFVNNCNRAKNAIRTTKHQRPSFAKFLETTAREHKGKLTLDNLLIKPVQKFPNYEMLFTRLIKHTDHDHPDQKHLQDVLKLVHDILVHINCKEREILENGQREATLRELEGVIEGITDLIAPERHFLLFDLVSMPSGQGARKERGFFLFNDLLVLTSIKKRSGTIRKPNTTTCPGTVASTLDTNKYKFLTKISLDCLDIVKTKDENLKRIMAEIENLAEDCNKLQQITDLTASLKYPHQYLEDVIRELHRDVQRQLSERQTNDAQLNMLELTVSSPNGSQKLSIVFSKAEKRSQWEETFNEAKQKLAATLERHPIPEFLTSIPIRKTRAGLQFTCAAATLSEKRDVWVCNSDGYVGQVCIMSLHPEPNVTSCNGVCNARILCVASVPAYSGSSNITQQPAHQHQHHHHHHHHSHQHHHHQHSDIQQQRDNRKSSSPNCQTPSVQGERRKQQVSATLAAPSGTTGSNSNSDIQLDLNLSSSDEEAEAALSIAGGSSISTERVPSPAPSTHTTASTSTASTAVMGSHQQQDSNPDESEGNQSTMWIGTEDGCIHVYNSTDNIRIKKNRIKIEHHSAVYSILYLDNRVFVSLANGDICVYLRDGVGWNTNSSHCISIGTVSSPISKLLSVHGKLWCSIQGIIKVLDIETLLVVNQIQISSDSKPITNMTVCNNYVWISIQNSAHIKCFHSNSHQLITEVNLAPAVNKMLSNCDEIIRQHKAACLRVTSLLSCKDLIWIGTSAGVLLTIPAQGYEKGAQNIVPTGIPHGHTGHVRFLTFVETTGTQIGASAATTTGASVAKDGENAASDVKSSSKHSKTKSEPNNILIISGGDGYEDFRNSGANSLSEIAGREDSTNHLLIWQI